MAVASIACGDYTAPGAKYEAVDPCDHESYFQDMKNERDPGYLKICDACCDNSGTCKEMVKTGGCTCDICGWQCKCCGDLDKQFVNNIAVRNIPSDGWGYLQWKNKQSLMPINWENLFQLGREDVKPK